MKKLTIRFQIQDENGNVENEGTTETEIDETISQELKFDYLSESDGGPVMRPSKPPR